MKDLAVFRAFVKVVSHVDMYDNFDKPRKALRELNDLLRSRGYDENVTWEDALRDALGSR